jgi:hypothetical protein
MLRSKHTLTKTIFAAALFTLMAVMLASSDVTAANRIFNLHLVNQTDKPVTFTVIGHRCYQGTPSNVFGPFAKGAGTTIVIARDQLSDCNNQNGYLSIEPSGAEYRGERQQMNFTNDGGLFISEYTNRYTGHLSIKSPIDESYTWSMYPAQARLATPPDERLLKPRNYVAYDSGYWGSLLSSGATQPSPTTSVDYLRFINSNGSWGSKFQSCFGSAFFHPQHIKRLPNMDGRAYFLGAQSEEHNGYIYLMETYPDMLDPITDKVKQTTDGSPVGKIIWQETFLGSFNGTNSPIGNWNHPAKMAVQGGVLAVVAQNWSEFLGVDGCSNSTSNPYQRGDSEDAILFYDIRDPQKPVFWGKMTASDLGLPNLEYCNGPVGFGRGGDARQIAVVSLTYSPETDKYILNAGIHLDKCHEKGDYYTTWETDTISPLIENWTQIGGWGTADHLSFIYTSGEHGDDFNSYQLDSVRKVSTTPANGVERAMTFTASENDGNIHIPAVNFEFGTVGGNNELFLYGAADPVDWISESLYITRKGVPIVYTLENAASPDGFRDNRDAYVHQVSDSRNSAALQTKAYPPNQVVKSLADSGPDTLRSAIRAGGRITFDSKFIKGNNTISLTSGPLLVYLYDVDIDASGLPAGIRINGSGLDRVLEIEPNTKVTLNGVTIENGMTQSIGGGILNQGSLTLLNSTVSNNVSWFGGAGIANNSGSLVMENCTIANNNILHGTLYGGAGVLNRNSGRGEPNMLMRHCTVAGNKSDAANPNHAGGVESSAPSTSLIIKNSILANNLNYQDKPSDLLGSYQTVGVNIIEADNGSAFVPSNVAPPIRLDPQLGSLKDNGGPTETFKPLRGSPAIDKGVTTGSPQLTDQRGITRPIGANPDIGAVELIITNRSPAFQEQNIGLNGEVLSWSGPPGASYQVYFDNGTGNLQPYGLAINGTTIGLGTLDPLKEYAWRVDTKIDGKTYTGDIWLFTTRGPLVVTTLLDESNPKLGQGMGDSLREAVAAALPGETITFAADLSGRPIILSGTEIPISQNLTIDASGLVGGIVVSANDQSRIFAIAGAQTVTLNRMTLIGGNSSFGGALINTGSALSIIDSTLSGNQTPDNGGAIYNWSNGNLSLTNTTVSNNVAGIGGGIYFNGESGGSLTIDKSSVLDNSASQGGGLFITGGTGLIVNSTFTDNSSTSNQGAAIKSQGSAALTVRHGTIVKNTGVGILNSSPATLTLDNTIVATNFNQSNTEADVQGDYTAVGANLIQSVSGTRLSGPAPIDLDPELSAIGLYGGRTKSMPPLAGSPVLSAGVTSGNTPSTDQRGGGYPRPNGVSPLVEIGAIESTLSSNADLQWLTTSAGLLSPAFLAGTTAYEVKTAVGTTTASVKAIGAIGDEELAFKVNGGSLTTLTPDTPSAPFPLNIGTNTVGVVVTASNMITAKSYVITIMRDGVDPTLASLTTDSGTVSPAFDPTVTDYNLTVPNGKTTVKLTPTTADSQAAVSISDDFGAFNHAVTSGNLSPALPLKIGANRFKVTVTARDGETVMVYTVTVTRQPVAAANADLSNLSSNNGSLSPVFNTGLTFYTMQVDTATIKVTPTAVRPGAVIRVKVNGGAFATVASGAASANLTLTVGANVVEVQVTAENGTTLKSYKIAVTRFERVVDWVSKLGDGTSTNPAISSDGLFVAFESSSTNLVSGGSNGNKHIFVYDVTAKTLEQVSKSSESGGGNEGDNASQNPSISADGRYVAFESDAENLVGDDSNGLTDVFVYDRQTKTTERVSLRDNGSQATNGYAETPSISGDGRYVAFTSGTNNLVSGFANGNFDVYIYDRTADTMIGVPVPFNVIASRNSLNPVFSKDGKFVAFEFSIDKSIENGNDGYTYTSIYLYDVEAKQSKRIIEGNDGVDSDGTVSTIASISADGRYIAFQSNIKTLDFYDTNGDTDVFVYDRETGLTRRVSTDSSGNQGNLSSQNPAISGNGEFIAFDSMNTTFATDTNGANDVFMKKWRSGGIDLVSRNGALQQANGDSSAPSVAFDGNSVAFQSFATNLDPLDNTNGTTDVYLVTNGGNGQSAVADLASLTTSADPLSPNFSAGVYGYSVAVPNSVSTLLVQATAAEAGATLKVKINSGGFSELDSGSKSAPLALNVGSNTVVVQVTAPDGSTMASYTLTVTRAGSSNVKLSSLLVFDEAFVTLTPSFSGSTLAYAAGVSKKTATVTVAPVSEHAGATIKVNGATVTSGDTSGVINLNYGMNTITVLVTAENGTTTQSYSVNVTREGNTKPVAYAGSKTVLADRSSFIHLVVLDSDTDTLTYTIVKAPTNGTLSGAAPLLIYTPNAGFEGSDSFSYKADDGTADSQVATVLIEVRAGEDEQARATKIYLPLIAR